MSKKKINGSGNGHDKDMKEGKIVHFPTLADRDRLRKKKLRQEEEWRRQYKQKTGTAHVPFFNFSKIPPLTRILALVFIGIHLPVYLLMDAGQQLSVHYTLGFVPGYFTGTIRPFPLLALATPFTHMLVHGGWIHLGFNLIMTLALGTFFERKYGTRLLLFFWLTCGLAGAAIFFALAPFATYPVIGASGAVSGLFASIIMDFHQQRERRGMKTRYGPWPLLGFWVLFMIGSGMIGGGNVAWQSHIGGFVVGIVLTHLINKGRIRL